MLLPTLRSAPVENSANAENISASVISATRCERRFRTFFFLKKVNRRKRFRNPAHRSKFKLYRPLGYIIIPKILTHIQQSNQVRMHFPAGIIPARAFLQIRMHFPDGNHPCKSFSAYQDAFPQRKSSLQDFSCKSGCISPLEIIPARAFQHIRMHFPAGNHPYKSFSAIQDATTLSRRPRRFQPFRQREENPSSFSAGKYPPGDFPALQTAAARRQACIPTPDNPSRLDLSV